MKVCETGKNVVELKLSSCHFGLKLVLKHSNGRQILCFSLRCGNSSSNNNHNNNIYDDGSNGNDDDDDGDDAK